jgi:hypothetical protein
MEGLAWCGILPPSPSSQLQGHTDTPNNAILNFLRPAIVKKITKMKFQECVMHEDAMCSQQSSQETSAHQLPDCTLTRVCEGLRMSNKSQTVSVSILAAHLGAGHT